MKRDHHIFGKVFSLFEYKKLRKCFISSIRNMPTYVYKKIIFEGHELKLTKQRFDKERFIKATCTTSSSIFIALEVLFEKR
jgi:hypothetical protein